MDPAGNADPHHGIREFIVGTGGESLDTLSQNLTPPQPKAPNLEASTDKYYGVLKLTLKPSGYDWDFESATPGAPGAYSDTGSGSCNGN
jgi:hypothetical protein